MSDLAELYRRVVLEHGRHPRNKRPAPPGARVAEGYNPVCGDRVVVHFREEGGALEDVAFDGTACVVCLASASTLTELVTKATPTEARALAATLRGVVAGDAAAIDAAPGDLAAFQGVAKYPVRVPCALLPWETLERALASRP